MKKYSSGLVSEAFWFIEFKKMVIMRHEGRTWDEIRELYVEQNMLAMPRKQRATRIYGYLKGRVETLDSDISEIFINSDLQTQKTVNIISIALKNRLFYEFLYEVYREKIQTGASEITHSDIDSFFRKKQEQDKTIGAWTEHTFKRLKGAYFTLLTESGLLKTQGNKKMINPPVLDESLESYLIKSGSKQLLKALTGVDI